MSIEALNWAWEQPVAKAANKLVLLALADHANGDGECWPSMKRIADRSDISARHVSRAINELVDLGLVEKANRRRHGGQYRGWDYRLLIQQTPAASGHGRPVTSGHGRPSPADTGVRSEPSENRKEEPLAAAPREAPTRKADDLFETVAQVCGISLDGITRTARGQLNKAVKELREVQATPEQIHHKAKAYRTQYPNATLTPTALTKHWSSFAQLERKQQRPSVWDTYEPPEYY
jgi:DNA-binding transcriptional ArsR family regulator